MFLEERKYFVKELNTSDYITDDINISSDDSDYSNEENSNE